MGQVYKGSQHPFNDLDQQHRSSVERNMCKIRGSGSSSVIDQNTGIFYYERTAALLDWNLRLGRGYEWLTQASLPFLTLFVRSG